MKLQTKIISVLMPLMIVPLLVTGWLSYRQMARSVEQRTVAEMQAKLAQAAVEVDTTLVTARANLELFANASLLSQYLLTPDAEQRYTVLQKPLLRLFASYQAAFPAYSEIRVLLPDGTEDVRRRNRLDEPRLSAALDKAFFSALSAAQGQHAAFVHDEVTGRVAFLLGAPIRLRGPEQDPLTTVVPLRGYLVIGVRPDFMAARVHGERIGKQGSLFVTDDHGHVLYHRLDGLGATLPAIMHQETVGHAQPFVAPIKGTETILLSRGVFENVKLFAMLPVSEVLADGKALGTWAALVTLVAIAVAASLLFLFVRLVLVRPIQELSRAAQEIGEGNLERRILIGRKDEVGELAAALDDMRSNLAASNERVWQIAYFDQLTGVPNRTLFHEYLPEAIVQTRLRNDKLALLLLDTDNFKRINDTLGHDAGDRLLREMAARLESCLRTSRKRPGVTPNGEHDLVARLGGDEFICVLPLVKSRTTAGMVARRILDAATQPLDLQGHEVLVTTSIGIALYPDDGEDAEELIKHADIAMYEAKRTGKNTSRFYAPAMAINYVERLALEGELRRAVEHREFRLHYQPIVDLETGDVAGAEALLRWQHPEHGIVTPDAFIAVAEATGLIRDIGIWAMREACLQLKAWMAAGLDAVTLSVNLSGVQFQDAELDARVAEILDEVGLPAQLLQVELTESTIIQSETAVADLLHKLHARGVRIALDDFGTGYSSLSYLRRFPIDALKIDKSFVSNLGDASDKAIVQAIIAMAESLQLDVTTEGVEQQEQLDFLRHSGCRLIQGYWFAKPSPPEQFLALRNQIREHCGHVATRMRVADI